MSGLYFEEFELGQVFKHAITRTITETDNLIFCALTHNPQPLHLDAEFAKGTEFGQRIVNSIFTLGLMIGVSVGDTTLGTTIANLGMADTRFAHPVFIGDTLRAETKVAEKAREQLAARLGHRRVRPSMLQPARRGSRLLQAVGADAQAGGVMTLRSLLFVPGDSERKLAKSGSSRADALVLDFEDAVAADRTESRARWCSSILRAHRDRTKTRLWVRINPLSTPKAMPDLAAIVAGAPDGIMLPKVTSANDVVMLDHFLSALEAREVSRKDRSRSFRWRPRLRPRCSRWAVSPDAVRGCRA